MSNAQIGAFHVRRLLLALAVACWLAGLFWIFDVLWPQVNLWGNVSPMGLQGVMGIECDKGGAYGALAACYAGLFLITQWFFLGPRGGWRVRLGQTGRPMRLSAMIAALMAALLTIAFFATAAEAGGFWAKIVGDSDNQHSTAGGPMLAALGASWAIWSVIFFIYWRQGNRATQISRMLRGLIGGSILELLVATPVHIAVLRAHNDHDQDCYCERGSYTGLVLGGTVLLWTFGPGLALLFLREKRRREPLLSGGPQAPDAAR